MDLDKIIITIYYKYTLELIPGKYIIILIASELHLVNGHAQPVIYAERAILIMR